MFVVALKAHHHVLHVKVRALEAHESSIHRAAHVTPSHERGLERETGESGNGVEVGDGQVFPDFGDVHFERHIINGLCRPTGDAERIIFGGLPHADQLVRAEGVIRLAHDFRRGVGKVQDVTGVLYW